MEYHRVYAGDKRGILTILSGPSGDPPKLLRIIYEGTRGSGASPDGEALVFIAGIDR